MAYCHDRVIWDHDENTYGININDTLYLGRSLLGEQLVYEEAPIPLMPGHDMTLSLTAQPRGHFLGVLVQFSRYEDSAHRV